MTENRRATVSTWDGSFNLSFKRASAIVTLVGTVLGICVLVYGSARAGVASAVRHELNHQIEAPMSPLNRQIEATIKAHEEEICEPRWKEVQDRLTDLEIGGARVETKIDMLLERTE